MTITFSRTRRRRVSILSPDYVISPPHPQCPPPLKSIQRARGCHHMIRTGAQVHMIITYHSAFLLLKSSGNGVPKESLSHNAVQAAATDPGPIRACRNRQGPLEVSAGSWKGPLSLGQPSGLGRALKLALAQVTKAGQVPFSHTQ